MGSRDLAGSSSAAALARLERYGVDDFTDAELLEMTIAAWSTAADAAAIAKRLLTRFGLYSDVLAAPRELLCEVEGVSHRLAARLKLVMYAAHRFADDRMANSRPPLTSVTELVAYCRTKMAFEPVEQLRAFFLNQKFTIIADEVVSRGGVNHVAIEEREVLRRAVQLRASNIVLAHNHPSGDPSPSHADIEATRGLRRRAEPLGITVYDHIVIGRRGHSSLRSLKYLDEMMRSGGKLP